MGGEIREDRPVIAPGVILAAHDPVVSFQRRADARPVLAAQAERPVVVEADDLAPAVRDLVGFGVVVAIGGKIRHPG